MALEDWQLQAIEESNQINQSPSFNFSNWFGGNQGIAASRPAQNMQQYFSGTHPGAYGSGDWMDNMNQLHNWGDSGARYEYNRPYNMSDVAGQVGEYSQRPGQGYNESMDTGKKKGFNLSNFFPGKAMYEGIAGMLPKMDPRQVALRNAYGYDNAGRVPQGELMAGYNPVSGGFLNTLTGGKFGKEPTYGLQGAYDKRIGTIDKTLAKWEADEEKYGERLKTTELYARRKALEEAKAAELNMLNKVKADQIAEANAAAAAAKAPTPAFNPQFDKAPPGGGGGGPTWHGATAARQKAGKSVSGPGFGKGAYWAEGGRVGYKTGGRVGILSVF